MSVLDECIVAMAGASDVGVLLAHVTIRELMAVGPDGLIVRKQLL